MFCSLACSMIKKSGWRSIEKVLNEYKISDRIYIGVTLTYKQSQNTKHLKRHTRIRDKEIVWTCFIISMSIRSLYLQGDYTLIFYLLLSNLVHHEWNSLNCYLYTVKHLYSANFYIAHPCLGSQIDIRPVYSILEHLYNAKVAYSSVRYHGPQI